MSTSTLVTLVHSSEWMRIGVLSLFGLERIEFSLVALFFQSQTLLPTSDMEAALHTGAVCFPRHPEGTYGLVCLAQQVSHGNL